MRKDMNKTVSIEDWKEDVTNSKKKIKYFFKVDFLCLQIYTV